MPCADIGVCSVNNINGKDEIIYEGSFDSVEDAKHYINGALSSKGEQYNPSLWVPFCTRSNTAFVITETKVSLFYKKLKKIL